jgi:hypothetical protein
MPMHFFGVLAADAWCFTGGTYSTEEVEKQHLIIVPDPTKHGRPQGNVIYVMPTMHGIVLCLQLSNGLEA